MARAATETANPVDLHVGARVRLCRKMAGISQGQLAHSLDLTFQQVQKYERGANRISASKLYAMAMTLQVPVSFFFEGLPDPAVGEPQDANHLSALTVQSFLQTPEGLELAELFTRLGAARLRRQILDLVRAVAKGD